MNDRELLLAAEATARESHLITAKLLHYLAEVDRRRLYAIGRYDSLFAYCVSGLKFSEAEAALRVNAARLIRDIPEVAAKIESGEMNLTSAAQAQAAFKQHAKAGHKISKEKKRQILTEMENTSTREAQRILLSHSQLPKEEVREKVRVVSEQTVEIKFAASPELLQKLETLKSIWGLSSLAEVITRTADLTLKAQEPKPTRAQKLKPKGRHIPADVKRQVRTRDQGCCVHVDPETGARCRSKFRIQFDHRVPFARGGKSTVENLRLLCFAHNQRHAVECFGSGVLRYTQAPED